MYIAACFTETKLHSRHLQTGEALLEKAVNNGYKLLALELSFALAKIYQSPEFEDRYMALSRELKLIPVLSRRQRLESWELALNNLLGVMTMVTSGSKPKAGKESRIIYFIDPVRKLVQPTLQTSASTGNWTKGRNIALKRLKAQDVEGMTEQDHRIAATIKIDNYYGWGDSSLYFCDDVWPALAGHPYLFMASNPDIPLELIKAQPAVTVEETDKGLVLKTDIDPGDEKFVIQKETNTRYKLISIDARQRAILQEINRRKMVIPTEGKEKLAQALGSLSGFFTIHSDMLEARQGTRTIESDPRIRVQLLPLGNSLKAELFVKPFGTVPPYCKPGAGGQNLIGMVGNERCHVNRDLKTETRHAEAILQEIQQNTAIDASQEPIVFDDPRDCLFLLEVLSRHQDIAIVEWPEGARFKVSRSASMRNLNMEVKGIDYWFELDGNLQVDENTVLSLKKLLELNARSHGRFIELGEGEFLALSADLKKRLDELQSYTDISGEHAKMNRFASLPLMELFGKAGSFKGDQKWLAFRKQLEEVEEIQPAIPKTLQAELRPYQEDGFRWLVRLSEWGAGACLADDMGLGKTVQALAILLYRAKMGAALVVCPASVVPNWVNETNRFAPTLNVVLLTQDNRKETLQKAGAFDLVITTYGLMQSEDKLFAREKWATVVLDEAHAIKNYHTKTSKAAMSLDAGFRLAMTGTPVQNHLGEVWNLFHFINPGLLGVMQQFNDRFVKTGEQGGKRLKKLVAPFILRRTKNSVLEELPPKTEIVKQVELSDEERIFYEAVRRQAIENLQNATGPAGQQHVRALAEITRLRLACCNPTLVEPDVDISSSKLATFVEIVDELRSNNHRALVFSQFVKHLTIIRQELDKRKIRYKYLDGTTTMADRERNVRDFQSGEGELFLISLKAGGLGINLTAADYVIHLDPWWNPAIEDQASDRAHRIGQKRPVTIYRLVSQHTIEEKIIRLHHTKRDIADHLLEGADTPGKLSTDELLKLIME
jgi:superfamily II DNA or RNA helicase